MKTKYFSVLLVTGAISLGTSPARANPADAPQLNFACELNNGVPTTVAQPSGSETTMPIFNWKQEALPQGTSATPQQLCDSVTEKLANYSANGYDLSQITFVGTEQTGLPAICATTAGKDCSKVLFTLAATDQPAIDADKVVTAILNPELQSNKTVFNDRGVQSTSYEVNFWQLFGLNTKLFGK